MDITLIEQNFSKIRERLDSFKTIDENDREEYGIYPLTKNTEDIIFEIFGKFFEKGINAYQYFDIFPLADEEGGAGLVIYSNNNKTFKEDEIYQIEILKNGRINSYFYDFINDSIIKENISVDTIVKDFIDFGLSKQLF